MGGFEIDESLVRSISHDRAADTLAGFLEALHVEAPAAAPVSRDRGVPLTTLSGGKPTW